MLCMVTMLSGCFGLAGKAAALQMTPLGFGDRPAVWSRSVRVIVRIAILLPFLFGPTYPVSSQPAFQEPDPAALQQQREQADRALHDAQQLLHDGALADHLRPAQAIPGMTHNPGRGLNFSLPGGLSESHPFIDTHVGQAVTSPLASRPPSPDDRIRPLILISFGMPDNQIRGLLQEAHRLKAAVVIRGLINDNWRDTIAAIHQLSGDGLSGISIDPTVFDRFNVSRVPTFVLPLERLEPCTQDGCKPVKHVRATGSTSLSYFLDFVSRVGKPEERHKARNWLSAHQGDTP